MAKFMVREGYAYYHPNIKLGFKAGSIIEIENIAFGEQPWKLEPMPEQAPSTLPSVPDEGTVEASAPIQHQPSSSETKETTPIAKRRGRPPKESV